MNPHVVVVGAGFGGIAAALRAKALGCDVTIVDKTSHPGGRAQRFQVDGYKHDAGPTVITAPFLFDELFALFGKERADYVEFKALNTWYRFVYDDGTHFDYGGDNERIERSIAMISPDDVKGYRKLLAASKEIYQLGFEQLAHRPFHQIIDMIKVIPQMLRLGSYRSVWQLVCRHLKHDKLRQAFSIQPLLVGGNPFDTTSIYSLIHYLERAHGVHFAMGGTQALVDALTKLMQEEGIEVVLNHEVVKFETQQKRITAVQLDNGHTLACDYCISNMDPLYLYRKLLPDHASRIAKIRRKVAKPSMGLFVLFFGSPKLYPSVQHHTIILGKAYKPLLDDIFHHGNLSEDISIYLHRPTATDPSFAKTGCDSFYALVPVPNLKSEINWHEVREMFQARVLQRLDETILPGIKENAESVFAMTPLDFKQNYNSEFGAGFSIAPLFYQSAWFRFHNRGESLDNLFLTGAGTHPGAGLPGVISSAKVAESLLKTSLAKHSSVRVNGHFTAQS
ncbi:phytoene dehydrogenase [Oleiphilus sp. HI0125]|uniref:phytoene desaturase family protein n=1 Tax=Oleiphilus sp. HI0125 TaxID=1822266 RepID=UPI0007C2222F|nr:phytoene desaturase family protein [Oleiphilus sp. HI0125]KZZ58047.1 phytoene dehydrogenase [Oleiphilus sp. HI0125]